VYSYLQPLAKPGSQCQVFIPHVVTSVVFFYRTDVLHTPMKLEAWWDKVIARKVINHCYVNRNFIVWAPQVLFLVTVMICVGLVVMRNRAHASKSQHVNGLVTHYSRANWIRNTFHDADGTSRREKTATANRRHHISMNGGTRRRITRNELLPATTVRVGGRSLLAWEHVVVSTDHRVLFGLLQPVLGRW
jgi:hypothetical protein